MGTHGFGVICKLKVLDRQYVETLNIGPVIYLFWPSRIV